MKVLHRSVIVSLSCFFFVFLLATAACGWSDRTHLAIAKAAGYSSWYNAAGADITKVKAGKIETANHWSDNTGVTEVTQSMAMDQVKRYNDASDEEGHLYGAIIASLRNYIADTRAGRYAEYHMAFCAHYIGDLSMPLHNVPYDAFNKKHHVINDGVVELSALNSVGLIQRDIYPIVIHNEHDLAGEIARIANIARSLAFRMEKEDRDMTKEEAYTELSHSASLLRAVLTYAKGKGKSATRASSPAIRAVGSQHGS